MADDELLQTFSGMLKFYQTSPSDFKSVLKTSKYDVDLQDDEKGRTLLCYLCETAETNSSSYINTEPFWTLLEYFADPNIKDKDGLTALHYAVRSKNKNLMLLLLMFGASHEIEDDQKVKPFDGFNEKEIVASMLEKVNNYKFFFMQLTRKRRNRLKRIFDIIDDQELRAISEIDLATFNMRLNDENHEDSRRDAKDFIDEASIFKAPQGNVSLCFEEYILGFAKILSHGYPITIVDDFIKKVADVESNKKSNKFDQY